MRSEGIKVSEEIVRQLMKEMGIGSIRQISKKLYEDECKKHKTMLINNLILKHRMKFG